MKENVIEEWKARENGEKEGIRKKEKQEKKRKKGEKWYVKWKKKENKQWKEN